MGERLDRLRSAVARAAASVKERAQESPLAKVRKAVKETLERKAKIPLVHLRRVVMGVPGVSAGSVSVLEQGGGHTLQIDLELDDGRRAGAELSVAAVSFAPRGPKEIAFRVAPPEAAAEPVIREVVGALGAVIARTLWSASLPPPSQPHETGLIDREGDLLRIDLRTLGAVRSAIQRGPAVAMLLDVIAPEAIDVAEDGLVVRVGLPPLGP